MIANIPLRNIHKAIRKTKLSTEVNATHHKKKREIFTKVKSASTIGAFGLVVANDFWDLDDIDIDKEHGNSAGLAKGDRTFEEGHREDDFPEAVAPPAKKGGIYENCL